MENQRLLFIPEQKPPKKRKLLETFLKNKIDEEILKLVNNSYNNVKKLLLENKENIKNVAKKLIEKETITGEEFENILKDNYDLSVLP